MRKHAKNDVQVAGLLTFEDDPPADPQAYSTWRKLAILTTSYNLIVNVTMASSLASNVSSHIMIEFGYDDSYGWRVLPVSIYLVGYTIGNTVLGPLSEAYGRKSVNVFTFFAFIIWTLASGFAPNWPALIMFRLLAGFSGGGASSTATGICADLYGGGVLRGRAILGYNVAQFWGPVLGPIVSGLSVPLSWHWAFWIGSIYAGVSFIPLLLMPETNPSIVSAIHQNSSSSARHDCELCRRELEMDGQSSIGSEASKSNQGSSWQNYITRILVRPMSVLFTEPIVFSICLYIAFQYGVFYMFFQSYSLIFEDIYGFSSGQEGLTFLGFGIGIILAVPVQLLYERLYVHAQAADKPWTSHHGANRLPLAMLGGPFIAISLFWSGWTSRASVHWIAPTLAGIPYGLGYTLNINALLNYLIDSYAEYASSANAASSLTRQIMGAALPFAATPMYRTLGIAWASSLLGFVAIGMSLIPVVFWIYGENLLEHSRLAQRLKEQHDSA